MAEKLEGTSSKQPKPVSGETEEGPQPSELTVTTAKGKKLSVMKLKTEPGSEPQPQIEQADIRAFKDRPIEHLEEAALREYEVEGDELEPEYEDMTEEDVQKEVEKLPPERRAHFKELKHLLTIQGRLKGKIPRMNLLINKYVKGRYPGIPSDTVAEHIQEAATEQQDIHRVSKEEIEVLIEEHDRKIPRRKAIVRPGRKGVTLSIDPYGDTELYTVDEMEDKIIETIVLTDDVQESTETQVQETPVTDSSESKNVAGPSTEEATPTTGDTPQGEQAPKAIVTDMLTEEIAKEYLVQDPDEDAETISSTSTADYDRDEAEELINQIASCHATLAQKYEDINKVVPHMTKTQLALYLGKVPVIPLVKPEAGHVTKVYSEEKAADPNYDFDVQGDSWEEKLDYLVKHVPAERLLFAIAIGDMQINQFSQAHTALKYGFAKTRIQRALSHDPSHKKGGRQYQQERKRKGQPKPQEEESTPAKQAKEQTPIPEAVLQHTEDDELADIPKDEQGDPIFPEIDV